MSSSSDKHLYLLPGDVVSPSECRYCWGGVQQMTYGSVHSMLVFYPRYKRLAPLTETRTDRTSPTHFGFLSQSSESSSHSQRSDAKMPQDRVIRSHCSSSRTLQKVIKIIEQMYFYLESHTRKKKNPKQTLKTFNI